MRRIAYSWLLNAQITRTAIWISIRKLYISSAAAWLISRRSRHGASFGTLTGRRRGMLVGGAGTILPSCWRRSCWCRRRGWRRRGSLVELISLRLCWRPPLGSVRTKLRGTVQAHDVPTKVAQHFVKVFVKSVFGEGCFRRDWRRDIGFCSSSRSVNAGPNFTKHHGTKSLLQLHHDHSSFFEPWALIV